MKSIIIYNILHEIRGKKQIINGSLFSFFSFINQGINFVLLVILAKYILPDDYGRLSLFTTIVSLCGFFIAFQSSGYMSISYFQDDNNSFKKNFTAIIELALFSLFILVAIVSVLLLFSDIDYGFPSYLLWVALCISFCTCISNMFLEYFRIKEKVLYYGLVSCSNAFLNFVLAILFVVTFKKGWVGKVDSQWVCSVVLCLISLYFFSKKRLFDHEFLWSRYKNLVLWGLPLIPHLASSWIRQGCDRYIINFFHAPQDVGLFSFALNLVTIITMIGSAFNATNSVSIYKTLSDNSIVNKFAKLLKQSKEILFVYIISTIVVVVFVAIFIPIGLPKYSGALPFFFILSIFGFLQCIYFLVCNFLFYYSKTKQLMYITFFSSILHLVLSLFLTRYSLFLTCAIYVLIHLLIVSLVFKKSLFLIRTYCK